MNLVNYTINDFVAEAASKSPAPGGGSVSALASSLGVALAQMVIRLTEGKKAFLALSYELQKQVMDSLNFFEKKQVELLKLIDEDTKAFNSFMAALALPRSSEEEKAKRQEAIHKATILALNIPLKTAQSSFEVIENLKPLALYGNKNAVSDVGVAALMADAGLKGSVLNVKINLQGLEEGDKKTECLKECEELVRKSTELCKEVLDIVNEKIS